MTGMFFTPAAAVVLVAGFMVAAFAPRAVAALGVAVVVLVLAGMTVEAGAFWPVFALAALAGGTLAVFFAAAPRKVGAR